MATHASTLPASVVGNSFVMRYYTVLNSSPDLLHHFYQEHSICLHGTEGLVTESATGMKNIQAKLSSSFPEKGSTVTLSVVDIQESLDGSVVVMVIGNIKNLTGPAKRFVQSFVLAKQQPEGFYVRNDVLRYVAEGAVEESAQPTPHPPVEKQQEAKIVQAPQPAPTTAPTSIPTTTPTATATATTATTPAAAPQVQQPQAQAQPQPQPQPQGQPQQPQPTPTPAPAKEAPSTPAAQPHEKPQPQQPQQPQPTPAAPAPAPAPKEEKPNHQSTQPQDTAAAPAPTAAPKITPAPAPANDAAPSKQPQVQQQTQPQPPKSTSWAGVAAAAASGHQAATPTQPPPSSAPAPASAAPSATQKPATQPQAKAPAAPGAAAPANKDKQQAPQKPHKTPKPFDPEADGRWVFVNNLPFDVALQQVITVFAALGTIKNTKPHIQKGYAFVEYESKQVAQSVIDHAKKEPIYLGGRHISVEERHAKPVKDRRNKPDKGDRPRPKHYPSNADANANPANANANTANGSSNGNGNGTFKDGPRKKDKFPHENKPHPKKDTPPPTAPATTTTATTHQ